MLCLTQTLPPYPSPPPTWGPGSHVASAHTCEPGTLDFEPGPLAWPPRLPWALALVQAESICMECFPECFLSFPL